MVGLFTVTVSVCLNGFYLSCIACMPTQSQLLIIVLTVTVNCLCQCLLSTSSIVRILVLRHTTEIFFSFLFLWHKNTYRCRQYKRLLSFELLKMTNIKSTNISHFRLTGKNNKTKSEKQLNCKVLKRIVSL